MDRKHRDSVKFRVKHAFGLKKRKKGAKAKKKKSPTIFTELNIPRDGKSSVESPTPPAMEFYEASTSSAQLSTPLPSAPDITLGINNASTTGKFKTPFNLIRDKSASKLKLDFFKSANRPIPNKNIKNTGFSFINLNSLDGFISQLACPICKNKTITLSENAAKRKGSAQHLSAYCSTCDKDVASFMTSPRLHGQSSKTPFEINTRLVTTAKSIGLGYVGLSDFCSGINLPVPMHLKTFQGHQKKVHDSSIAACSDNFNESVSIIKTVYRDMFPENRPKEVIDIVVSFDGTWMKRGHTSHFGVGVVIELMTGLVIDFCVLSNYCHGCAVGPKHNDDLYDQWKQKHECYQNTNVSSGSMEPESAKIMWGRSVSNYGLRYTTILSDGDSKTFKTLVESTFPGYENCILKKEECVNHVEKRMGTALRGIVDEFKAKKTPISGKGRLSKEVIDHLTRYYGWAIKDHSGDLEGMYNAIWATLFHISSTDDIPFHHRCPKGLDSWCFFNKALENNETPRKHKPLLTKEVAEVLIPIYRRISDYDLLSRCMEGKTQNPNESVNACIWKKCLKISFASLPSVETAVSLAVASFNKGSQYLIDVYKKLEIKEGEYTSLAGAKKDARRISDAERRHSNAFKYQRIELKKKGKKMNNKRVKELLMPVEHFN